MCHKQSCCLTPSAAEEVYVRLFIIHLGLNSTSGSRQTAAINNP